MNILKEIGEKGYWILDGKTPKEVGLIEWSKWLQSANRTVNKTEIQGVNISTVFLGIDHRFLQEGEPILFETMIFGGEHDQYQERYCTFEEAEAGHQRAINLVLTA